MTITIYTDGSCSPNPGAGGWAFVINREEEQEITETRVYGGLANTTNNVMEMTAVIEAIKTMGEEKVCCTIYSDSQYVINCAKGSWKRKANVDLWKRYDRYALGKTIEFVWVRGHSGDRYNELVDRLANAGREKYGKK